jgi:hypothetical protein
MTSAVAAALAHQRPDRRVAQNGSIGPSDLALPALAIVAIVA